MAEYWGDAPVSTTEDWGDQAESLPGAHPGLFADRSFKQQQWHAVANPGSGFMAGLPALATAAATYLPITAAESLADLFTKAHKQTFGDDAGQGLTPEEQWDFGFNAAQLTIGTGAKFMTPKTRVPVANEFHEDVVQPVVNDLVQKTATGPTRITVPLDPANVATQADAAIDNLRKLSDTVTEARSLGVVGGDRPDLIGVSPKEAGRNAMAATAKPGEKITQDVDERSEWRQRFESTLDKMATPDDARQVIGAIVDANDEFRQARQGNLSSAQIEQLGVAAGVDTGKVDVAATSSKIKTDAEMRNTIEAFTSLNGKIKEAADAVRAKNGLEDDAEIAEMKRLELQRDLLLDATVSTREFVALRAEFGRLGNRIQEFMTAQKEANAFRQFMREDGDSMDGIRQRAGRIADTDIRALPKVLNPRSRGPQHWSFWLWQNALISGLITHTKYAVVNTAQTVFDRVISPLGAAALAKARGQDASLMAPVWGYASLIHAIPDAARGAAEAFKTNERVPLISEMELAARGKESPQAGAQATPYQSRDKVNWGVWKRVFNADKLKVAETIGGTPGRSANALHTFYKILNERASLGSRAYEQAYLEKTRNNSEFWQRYEYHYANPSDENLAGAVGDGYSGTFMEKLGPYTQGLSSQLKRNPLTRWLFPFMHIPLNIAKSGISYSPLAGFAPEMRASIMGRNGEAAQNLAIAKVVVGTSVMSYFVAKAMGDQMTGSYPIDRREQQRWRLMGIQPNSVDVDGQWHSMERLGPIGMLAGYAADLEKVISAVPSNWEKDGGQKAIAKAVAGLGIATANSIADDVGFQTLRNFMDVLEGKTPPEKFFAYEASTFFVPSLVRQIASWNDPYMREAKSLVDGLKYAIPFAREGLMPKRDVLFGEPVANPGYHTFGREVPAQADPIKQELERIQYYPSAPSRKIGNVTLSDEQYDKYEATAGPLVKAALTELMESPDWAEHNNQPEWQKQAAKTRIKQARATARGVIQADSMANDGDDNLVENGIDGRLRVIIPRAQ